MIVLEWFLFFSHSKSTKYFSMKGTKIIFTNISKNVTVNPKGKAKVAGNDITFIVEESVGEVSVNVKVLQTGDWVINYTL